LQACILYHRVSLWMCIINVWSAVELLFIVQFLNLWHIYDIDLIIINISDIQDNGSLL